MFQRRETLRRQRNGCPLCGSTKATIGARGTWSTHKADDGFDDGHRYGTQAARPNCPASTKTTGEVDTMLRTFDSWENPMQGRKPGIPYVRYVAVLIVMGGPLLSGCDAFDTTPNAEYGGVCVDQVTQERIDDDYCGDWDGEGVYSGGPGYHGYSHGTYMMWYPINYGGHVPGIGQKATGGLTKVPAGKPIAKGVPKAGATAQSGGMAGIQRGGFGVKAGTSGGIGAKAGTGAVGGKSGGS